MKMLGSPIKAKHLHQLHDFSPQATTSLIKMKVLQEKPG